MMIRQKNQDALTQARLKELLHYDSETGLFTWRKRRGGPIRAGDVAGTAATRGYIQIRIDGVKHFAHRLAFLYMTGVWPKNVVDHDDRCTSNNRWKNLIDSTQAENMQNLTPRGKKPIKFGVSVQLEGSKRSIHLGWFDTPEAANKALVDYQNDFQKSA